MFHIVPSLVCSKLVPIKVIQYSIALYIQYHIIEKDKVFWKRDRHVI